MTGTITGGCLCQAIRYAVRGPIIEAGYCHCRLCQLATGSPVVAFATVAVADYHVLTGEPQIRRSSDIGERWFCSTCGTPLAMRVDHQPDTIDFTIPTLDDPSAVVPTFHIWVRSRIPWFNTTDDCARYDRFRRVTAGLQDSEIEAERI